MKKRIQIVIGILTIVASFWFDAIGEQLAPEWAHGAVNATGLVICMFGAGLAVFGAMDIK